MQRQLVGFLRPTCSSSSSSSDFFLREEIGFGAFISPAFTEVGTVECAMDWVGFCPWDYVSCTEEHKSLQGQVKEGPEEFAGHPWWQESVCQSRNSSYSGLPKLWPGPGTGGTS